jgi:hypothetical protein
MHTRTLIGAAAALVIGMPSRSANAQLAPCTPGVKSYIGNGVILQSGLPYSATLTATFTKKLADGNVIQGVTRTFEARDSSGRARMETSLGCGRDKDGKPYDRLLVNIADPNSETRVDWSIGGPVPKVAHLLHEPGAFPKSVRVAVEIQNSQHIQKVAGQPTKIIRSEALGSKFIEGISVEGQRITVTVPVGEEGNSAPIVEVHERWTSRELGLLMEDVVDDPARGRTEMVFENFSRLEPDRNVFAPPDGYTIEESHPKATRPMP